uniref:Uncharacterized protein n=1 Tax=Hemiselmis andersenii TaxID=464988 RepID=A0A7S1H2Z0_HEMAN
MGKGLKGKGEPRAKKARHQLTEEEAVAIFNLRPKATKDGNQRRGSMTHCKIIAPKYGVTPKTVRDIWNGRTWWSATKQYWSKEEKARRAFQIMPDSFPPPQAAAQSGALGVGQAVHPASLMIPGVGMPPQPQDRPPMFPPGLVARGLPYVSFQGGGAYPGGMMGGMQGAAMPRQLLQPADAAKLAKQLISAPTAAGGEECPSPTQAGGAGGQASAGLSHFGQGGLGYGPY